ncbi:MAG: DUF5131 family protein [Cyanobium sp.]
MEELEEWVLAIRDLCQQEGVAFFFKQWGGVRKKATGRLLEGRTWGHPPLPIATAWRNPSPAEA